MKIKYLNKNIEIDKNCFQVSAFSIDDSIEKVFNILTKINRPVFLDIGSNIGQFSLIATLIPDLIVFSFEPYPKIYKLLRENISLNGLKDRVKVFNIGLFSQQAEKKLKCCVGKNSGLSCIGPNFQLNIPYIEKKIKTDTIDNIVRKENIKKIDFIKIDTEGCEYFIIKGGEKTIREFHPTILIENVQKRTINFNITPENVINLLKKYGYQEFIQFSKNDVLAQ